jgi:hypothetical protein
MIQHCGKPYIHNSKMTHLHRESRHVVELWGAGHKYPALVRIEIDSCALHHRSLNDRIWHRCGSQWIDAARRVTSSESPANKAFTKFMPAGQQWQELRNSCQRQEFIIAVASEHLAEPPSKKSGLLCILMETRVAASKRGHVATRTLCGAHVARLQSQDALKQSLVQSTASVP